VYVDMLHAAIAGEDLGEICQKAGTCWSAFGPFCLVLCWVLVMLVDVDGLGCLFYFAAGWVGGWVLI
jgi:hypothetical protein